VYCGGLSLPFGGVNNRLRIITMGEQQSVALPPEYAGLTFEKVWAMFQETGKQMREHSQETERLKKEQSQETDKKFQETDKKFQETERLMKEHSQETEKKFQEAEKLVRQNQKMMGDLGRKFGKIIEHMFIPNLEEKFNALGYEFGKAGPNVRIASNNPPAEPVALGSPLEGGYKLKFGSV
jgi:hypothetical protein